MARPIFHQGAAKVSACEMPCAAEIEDAVVDVDIGFCEFGIISPESEHRRGFGPHLHQTDLADAADGARVVAAFNEDNGLCDVGGQIGFGCFSFDDGSDRSP